MNKCWQTNLKLRSCVCRLFSDFSRSEHEVMGAPSELRCLPFDFNSKTPPRCFASLPAHERITRLKVHVKKILILCAENNVRDQVVADFLPRLGFHESVTG
jgi:hypothetical protein